MMEFGGRWWWFWEMKVEGEVEEGWVERVGGTRLLMKLVIIMSRATTFSLLEKTKWKRWKWQILVFSFHPLLRMFCLKMFLKIKTNIFKCIFYFLWKWKQKMMKPSTTLAFSSHVFVLSFYCFYLCLLALAWLSFTSYNLLLSTFVIVLDCLIDWCRKRIRQKHGN